MTPTTFTREVTFEPAFDKRSKDPSKNYGVHGVNLKMVLKNEKGAVQFVVYTNWHLPSAMRHMEEATAKHGLDRADLWKPLPADLGYHSPEPRYEGDEPTNEACEYLDGRPCYYDGSGLNAERVFQILLEKGSEGVRKELEDYHRSIFGGAA